MTDTVERKTLTREHLLDVYRTMRTIREFEERVHAEFATGEIPGFVHLYAGEEASAVGVCSNLDEQDTIASTHRGHGHCIARGVDVGEMMAEIYGRKPAAATARATMHIADLSKGMLGANGIVGGGPPLITPDSCCARAASTASTTSRGNWATASGSISTTRSTAATSSQHQPPVQGAGLLGAPRSSTSWTAWA